LTSTVERRTLRVVLAIALQSAVLAVLQEGTGPVASCTAPARFAVASAIMGMTQQSVLHLAFTVLIASVTESSVRAFALGAVDSRPPWSTIASSVSFVARCIVDARTRAGAVDSEFVVGTLIEAFVSDEAWFAHAVT
jgi:urease accessory protein UreF